MTVYAYRLVMEEDDGQEQDIVYCLELQHSTSLDRWSCRSDTQAAKGPPDVVLPCDVLFKCLDSALRSGSCGAMDSPSLAMHHVDILCPIEQNSGSKDFGLQLLLTLCFPLTEHHVWTPMFEFLLKQVPREIKENEKTIPLPGQQPEDVGMLLAPSPVRPIVLHPCNKQKKSPIVIHLRTRQDTEKSNWLQWERAHGVQDDLCFDIQKNNPTKIVLKKRGLYCVIVSVHHPNQSGHITFELFKGKKCLAVCRDLSYAGERMTSILKRIVCIGQTKQTNDILGEEEEALSVFYHGDVCAYKGSEMTLQLLEK